MSFTRQNRKIELLRLGLSGVDIARELGVHESLVSHVIAGRRLGGGKARLVMVHIARLFGAPVSEVFPGSERRVRRTAA